MNCKLYKADCIVIGGGIFGLYAAKLLASKKKKVVLIEKGQKPFARASTINQARVHNGYHYPRCYETAKKVAYYYNRFNNEFSFAINKSFKHIYAISSSKSKTSADEFIKFCTRVSVPAEKIDSGKYFKRGKVEASFRVEEPAFDYLKIRDYLVDYLSDKITFIFDTYTESVEERGSEYYLSLANGDKYSAPKVVNATYAGINEIIGLFKQEPFKLKYELCEVALCKVSDNLKNLGFTVMDGDFFSIMPFGGGNNHSLTSVGHTPHEVSYKRIPVFSKAVQNDFLCKMHHVRSCTVCSQLPRTAFNKMFQMYKTYMNSEYSIEYKSSMFEIKPILIESEDDDSRPTIIKRHTKSPSLISVFSGKISTIYDLEQYL